MIKIIQNRLIKFRNEIEEVNAKRQVLLDRANANYIGDKLKEETAVIENKYNAEKRRIKQENRAIIDDTLKSTKIQLKEKVTETITSEAMNDIELLKQMNDVSENEIKMYVEKYKSNIMLLKLLKQVADNKGYIVNALTLDEAIELVDEIENLADDLIDNYKDFGSNYRHEMILRDADDSFMSIKNEELKQILKNEGEIKVLKKVGQ